MTSWSSIVDDLYSTSIAQFGKEVGYRQLPPDGATVPITVILSYVAASEQQTRPTAAKIFSRLSDFAAAGLSAPSIGEEVVDGADTYRVVSVDADPRGTLNLALRLKYSV